MQEVHIKLNPGLP